MSKPSLPGEPHWGARRSTVHNPDALAVYLMALQDKKQTPLSACIHTYVCARMCAHVCVFVHMCMPVCVRACMCLHVRACVIMSSRFVSLYHCLHLTFQITKCSYLL